MTAQGINNMHIAADTLLVVVVKEEDKGKKKKRRRVCQELSSDESDEGIVNMCHVTLM